MRIADGTPEDHPTPLPLDASNSPALAQVTPVVGQLSGSTVPAADVSYPAQVAGVEADCAAAMAAGQAAELERRQHYAQDILPQGGAYGDAMNLPPVPANVVPAEDSDLYPWAGMEPTPAAAGLDYYPGQLPQQ